MGIVKEKTFEAASKEALDVLVNAYIGKQTVDGAVLDRQPKFFQFIVVGGVFYASIIVEEINFSSRT